MRLGLTLLEVVSTSHTLLLIPLLSCHEIEKAVEWRECRGKVVSYICRRFINEHANGFTETLWQLLLYLYIKNHSPCYHHSYPYLVTSS